MNVKTYYPVIKIEGKELLTIDATDYAMSLIARTFGGELVSSYMIDNTAMDKLRNKIMAGCQDGLAPYDVSFDELSEIFIISRRSPGFVNLVEHFAQKSGLAVDLDLEIEVAFFAPHPKMGENNNG